MCFIKIGSTLFNVSKINFIRFYNGCIDINIDQDIYYFNSNINTYNNIIDFINNYGNEKNNNVLKIDNINVIYKTYVNDQFRRVN